MDRRLMIAMGEVRLMVNMLMIVFSERLAMR